MVCKLYLNKAAFKKNVHSIILLIVKFTNRQNESMVLEARRVVTFCGKGQVEFGREQKRKLLQASNVPFPDQVLHCHFRTIHQAHTDYVLSWVYPYFLQKLSKIS